MADLQCHLKFCCTAMWLSYTHKNIYYVSYSFSCGLSLDIEYSSLLSTVGLCCLSFHCFPNSQSSTHQTLPHGSCIYGPLLVLDELSHPLLLIKPLDTYQKREIKSKNVAVSGYLWELHVRAQSDWNVSNSPRNLAVTALLAFKGAEWIHLQRPGPWVTSSWGCIFRSLIEEMTGLAWHRQCKLMEWFRNQ